MLSLPTAAEAEWEGILYAMKCIDKRCSESSCWSPPDDVGTLGRPGEPMFVGGVDPGFDGGLHIAPCAARNRTNVARI